MQTFAFFCGGWTGEGIADTQARSHRCDGDTGVVQIFCLGRKSLLVREILIDDTKRANNTTTTVPNRVKILKEKFVESLGLPFQDLLPESAIQQAIDELKIKYRCRLFDPFVTLWAFLSQVLTPDKSCHNAVSRVIAYLVNEGVEIPSTDTSAYCQARSRLPDNLLEKLFSKTAQSLEEKVTTEYLWCGRSVKVIDGSSVSMPDTIENQKAYPLTL